MSIYTVVQLRIGTASCPRCTADMFEPDTLTITRVDDGATQQVYRPGDWRECAVYEDDQLAFGFTSKTPCAPIQQLRTA